ncbi:SDR family NAD(P)-dependent oxidoreductase [Scytonema sp. NUACC26]|uniref:SDR family NAD(P)-dependent oxidoreductase n=1 Tax=Scytonema sp. NUACC26 TaxID=3140176 RepID=UPI0034DBDC2C
MAGKLEGKVAIVTGASAGIGEATALALASEGAQVALAARRVERLKPVAERIESNGGKALIIVADVANETQAIDIVHKTKAEFGRIDILVNNAGVALVGDIDGANTADWRRMFDINVLGLMYVTHAALPIFKAQGSGHVVNISSVAGRTVRAGIGAYNVSKWGVNAFSEALRQEVHKQNIRVTIVEPGMVNTEINDFITDPIAKQRSEERRKSIVPLESEDVAVAIVYAVTQPLRVSVNEILIRPTDQGW